MTLQRLRTGRRIGPVGTVSRLAVAAVFLWAGARSASWTDAAVGLFAYPAVLVGVFLLRGRHTPPVRLLGGDGYLLMAVLGAVGFWVDAPAMMLFVGVSLLVAAAVGYAGCELLAFSNIVLGRDDQIACILFTPLDRLDFRPGGGDGSRSCGSAGCGG